MAVITIGYHGYSNRNLSLLYIKFKDVAADWPLKFKVTFIPTVLFSFYGFVDMIATFLLSLDIIVASHLLSEIKIPFDFAHCNYGLAGYQLSLVLCLQSC